MSRLLTQNALEKKALRPSNLAWSAYELEIHTKPNVSQNVNALRGRIFPPHAVAAAGKKRDTIVVFAEEKEGQAAKDAGADVVGGAALATQVFETFFPFSIGLFANSLVLSVLTISLCTRFWKAKWCPQSSLHIPA